MAISNTYPLAGMEQTDLKLLIDQIKQFAEKEHNKVRGSEISLSLPTASFYGNTTLNIEIKHNNPKSPQIDITVRNEKDGLSQDISLYHKDARHESFYEDIEENRNLLRSVAHDVGLNLEAISKSMEQAYIDIEINKER